MTDPGKVRAAFEVFGYIALYVVIVVGGIKATGWFCKRRHRA